ncbi:hypothetical protein EV1_008216 [Malus domestica]
MAERVQAAKNEVAEKLAQMNSKNKAAADKHRCSKIVHKINDNAYVVDLPTSMGISRSFNVTDLHHFHLVDVPLYLDHSGTSSFQGEKTNVGIKKLLDDANSLETPTLFGNEPVVELEKDVFGINEVVMEKPTATEPRKKQNYVSQSAVALRCRVMPPPCLKNPMKTLLDTIRLGLKMSSCTLSCMHTHWH